ncbi:MAG: peptidylprolyl isomerase [Bacteroidota bacterium]
MILLSACQGDESNQSNQTYQYDQENSQAQEAEEDQAEAFRLPRLTNENVRDILIDFGKKNPETQVLMKTRLGDMKIRLYDETPIHRANFLQLVKRGYYEGTVFHRVVKDLIIQGGNLDNPIIRTKKNQVGFYRVPAEIKPQLFIHKKGALASPRRDEENPEKRSNPFEFYIVQGGKVEPPIAQALGQQNGVTYNHQQLQTYALSGGLPHLDGKYTVFGEVIEGLEVIEKIAALPVDESDNWPFDDVVISVEVLE